MNGWPRGRWLRFIVYLFLLGLFYHCFVFLLSASSHNPQQPSSSSETIIANNQERRISPNHRHQQSSTALLPWYQQPHPNLVTSSSNYTTTHLSPLERLRLHENAVARAKQVAEDVIGRIEGIPGTFKDTAEAANTFRSLVDCWTRGRWTRYATPFLVKNHFQDPLYGSCDRKAKGNPRDALRYAWQPTCPLGPVDPTKWCEALDGRHMLMVGDLVQYAFHDVVLDVMRDGPTVCYGDMNCKDHTVCSIEGSESKMRFIRNDVLSTVRRVDRAKGHPSAEAIQMPFVSSNMLRAYSVYILSRGMVKETDEDFIRELVEAMRLIRQGAPDALIIYRSASVGHPYCDDARGPLEAKLSDDQLRLLPYGWSELDRRNAMARAIVETAGGVFVDMAAITDVRPDGHVGGQDCLRYCIPGPMDTWALILYHVLVTSRNQLY